MRNEKSKSKNENLKDRTRKFAIEIIKLIEDLPRNRVADVIGKQLLRSGTSIGANYRAACRARSKADFIAKMGIVEEEADEVNELIAIIVTSIRTARGNLKCI